MTTSKFDEIRELYVAWEDIRTDRFHECIRLTMRVSEGFRHYIGAPEAFETFDSTLQHRKSERYVRIAKVSELDENDLYHFDVVENSSDALQHDEIEGTLVFGVILTVDRARNAFPKYNISFRISIRFEDGNCFIRLYNKEALVVTEADIAKGGNNDILNPLFKQMTDFVLDAFKRDPWEKQNRSTPIGFGSAVT